MEHRKQTAFEAGRAWGTKALQRATRDRYKQALDVMAKCRCSEGFAIYWRDFVAGATAAIEEPDSQPPKTTDYVIPAALSDTPDVAFTEDGRDAAEIPGVYFAVSGGVVEYVGQSANVRKRIRAHLRNHAFHNCYWYYIATPPEQLDKAERNFIQELTPRYNVACKPKR